MTTRKFKTTLIWPIGLDEEVECEAMVSYVGRKGFAGDRIDPPEDASVEIIEIKAIDGETVIPDSFFEDDGLMAECFEDWRDDEIAAAEYRAEQRAETLREERHD